MIGYFTSKASSSEIPRQKYVKNINMKRDISLQSVTYIKMIRKCKFQMAHNPSNINHFEKKCFGKVTVPP